MPIANKENLNLFIEGKRKCCKCLIIKSLTEFTKSKQRLNGYSPRCKDCDLKYRKENDLKYKEQALNWRKQNRKFLCEKEKRRREEIGKEQFNLHKRILYQKNKEYHALKRKEKMKNPIYKMEKTLRDRLYHAIRKMKFKKYSHTKDLLGMEFTEIKLYIESLWKPGMSWENYGHGTNKWCIDHIIPCAAFDLSKEDEQKKCFHYTNLQPLWYSENACKNSIYNNERHYYNKGGGGVKTPPSLL